MRGDFLRRPPGANADEPPLPISDDGLPCAIDCRASWRAIRPLARPAATLAAKPAADDPSYRLPSLKLASDGPVLRLLEPTNDGPWSPDQAVLPWAEFHDNQVTVHNIRNSYYRTVDDYTVRLYNKTFDLRKLTSVDFIVVPFNDNPSIAHVMLSFGFEDKDYLVSSVEIRKRAGQSYSALTGFFNQYTLMYVLADERDMIWKETIGFQQEAFVYRTKATPKQAQEMFVDVMRRVNKLVREPEFYNTITNNCTTNVRNHVNHLIAGRRALRLSRAAARLFRRVGLRPGPDRSERFVRRDAGRGQGELQGLSVSRRPGFLAEDPGKSKFNTRPPPCREAKVHPTNRQHSDGSKHRDDQLQRPGVLANFESRQVEYDFGKGAMAAAMNRYEKTLAVLLRLEAIVLPTALIASLMPFALMKDIHRCLGDGRTPRWADPRLSDPFLVADVCHVRSGALVRLPGRSSLPAGCKAHHRPGNPVWPVDDRPGSCRRHARVLDRLRRAIHFPAVWRAILADRPHSRLNNLA